MKPANWKQLSRKETLRIGSDLFTSPRGKYIVSEALAYAIAGLKDTPAKQREQSAIDDMEILHETIFDRFPIDRVADEDGPVKPASKTSRDVA